MAPARFLHLLILFFISECRAISPSFREVFREFTSRRAPVPPSSKGGSSSGGEQVGIDAMLADDAFSSPSSSSSSTSSPRGALASTIAKARHSVVQVITTSTKFNWERPWETVADDESTGSGFFVELQGKGFILTNGHVIKEAVGVLVTLPAFGNERFQASVYAVCHDKDIALLSLQDSAKQSLLQMAKVSSAEIHPLALDTSTHFEQGSMAVALGYPLGHPNLKATTGILAGTEHVDGRFYLQVTTPINPGNSGGPLLNSAGVVMGINTAAIESASNVGYAIPSSHFNELLNSFVAAAEDPLSRVESSRWADRLVTSSAKMRERGEQKEKEERGGEREESRIEAVAASKQGKEEEEREEKEAGNRGSVRFLERIWSSPEEQQTSVHASFDAKKVVRQFPILGLDLLPATTQLGPYLGWHGQGGVQIAKVHPRGLFRLADAQPGDLLLEFDGHTLDRFGEVQLRGDCRLNVYDLAERAKFGANTPIKVWRNGSVQELTVRFDASPHQSYSVHHVYEPVWEGVAYEVFGGVVFMELTLNHVSILGDSNERLSGFRSNYHKLIQKLLTISNLLTESNLIPPTTLSAGDIVTKINGKPVSSLEDYRQAFRPDGDSWTLETDTGALVVLNFTEALEMEPALAQLNRYELSSVVEQAAKRNHGLSSKLKQPSRGAMEPL